MICELHFHASYHYDSSSFVNSTKERTDIQTGSFYLKVCMFSLLNRHKKKRWEVWQVSKFR